MDKIEGKHHICSCFPNAFIWLLTSIFHLFPNNGYEITYPKKESIWGVPLVLEKLNNVHCANQRKEGKQ